MQATLSLGGWEREVEAVAFDLDDTLFDRGRAVRRLFERELGEVVEEAIRRDAHGQGPRREFLAWVALRRPAMVPAFTRWLIPEIREYAAVTATLGRLADSGRLMAVLSNGRPAVQWAKLRACGLARFFKPERVLLSGAIGFEKPDPRAFELLVEVLGVPPERILFVGDDPVRDIDGARRAGMVTCRLRRPGRVMGAQDADFVINSLAELNTLAARASSH